MTMEAVHRTSDSILQLHILRDLIRALQRRRFQSVENGVGQFLCRQLFIWNRLWSGTSPGYDRAPERLVAKEWDHHCWTTKRESGGGSPGSSVVHHARYMLEKPIMRTVSQHVYIFWNIDLVRPNIPPAFANYSTATSCLGSIKNYPRQFS